MRRFLRFNGLSLTLVTLFIALWLGQAEVGRHEYNAERRKAGQAEESRWAYFRSPHFLQATAENWESEFLQMGIYILGTAWLFQKGSSESNDPCRPPRDKEPAPVRPDSPWPARRGGWVLRLYEHSLSGAFLLLFLAAFALHAGSGLALYNEERHREHEPAVSLGSYLASSRFWFESLQNWQSEFLAIVSMVVLSIYLRERHSPESKRVETPHGENEE